MKKVKSGAKRRAGSTRKLWNSVGAVVSHLLAGLVVILALVAVEAAGLAAMRWLTGLVKEHWFTLTVNGLDVVFLVVDIALVLFWLVRYALRSVKEMNDE